MFNSSDEIFNLLNILLNDKRPLIDYKKYIKDDNNINEEGLKY